MDKLDEVAELLLGDYADGGLRDNPELAAIAGTKFTLSAFEPGKGFVDISSSIEQASDREFMLSILDLYSGSSILATTPSRRTALINTGGKSGYKGVVDRYIGGWGLDVGKIDDLVLTAPYQELVDGVSGQSIGEGLLGGGSWRFGRGLFDSKRDTDLYGHHRIGQVTMPQIDQYSRRLQKLQSELDTQGISRRTISHKDIYESDLAGKPRHAKEKPMKLSIANQSLVTRVQYGDFSALMLGNAGKILQAELAKLGAEELRSSVLVVPEQFATTVSEELIDLISPEAIIMSGSNRAAAMSSKQRSMSDRYQLRPEINFPFPGSGRPGVEPTWANLQAEDVGRYPVFSTAEHGRIELYSSGKDWKLSAPTSTEPLIDIPATRYDIESPVDMPRREPLKFAPGVDEYSRAFKQPVEKSWHKFMKLAWWPLRFFTGYQPYHMDVPEVPERPEPGIYKVRSVEDADTINVEGLGLVRLLGIDTPEMNAPLGTPQPFAQMGTDYVTALLKGKNVRLEFDETSHDIYGRPLAYVFLGNTLVNAELVKKGYARKYNIAPNIRYQSIFSEAERGAKEIGIGIWSEPEPRRNMQNLPPPSATTQGLLLRRTQPILRRRYLLQSQLSETLAQVSEIPELPVLPLPVYDSRVEYPV